jgi:hypothetical protein
MSAITPLFQNSVPDESACRSFVANFPGIWWKKDLQGRIIETSPNYESELGVLAADVIGHTAAEAFGPRYGSQMDILTLKVIKSGRRVEDIGATPGRVWHMWEYPAREDGRTLIRGAAMSVFSAPQTIAPMRPCAS